MAGYAAMPYPDAPLGRLSQAELDELHELDKLASPPPLYLDTGILIHHSHVEERCVVMMSRDDYRFFIRARERMRALLGEVQDWRHGRI